jgi:DNA-binding NarL/FixJ family response regulator
MSLSVLDREDRRIAKRFRRNAARGDVTLLVVEDAPPSQEWLASVLREAFPGSTVLIAATVGESVALIAHHAIDIALIDFCLPDGSGVDVIRRFARLSPATRCVIATVFDDDGHLMPALGAGALGYLLNNQPVTVLIEQLRLLAEGVPPLAPSVARRLVRRFAELQAGAGPAPGAPNPEEDELRRLSEREKQVLGLIAKGLPIGQVAQALDITANTVCSHIKSIYRKRHVCTRAEAALEARRLGLV